jgi:hypothetical protein
VYGGITIDATRAAALSAAIEQLRVNAGVSPDFILKFNPGPPNLNHQHFLQLKQDIIQAAVDHGCTFITSLILHNVATSPDVARRNEINRVSYHFDLYLGTAQSNGLVLIDQFTDTQINHHLREKFLLGLKDMPYGPPNMRLNRILGFHYAAIGQSHFGSLIDIVIGSFRFAINAHTRNQTNNLATAGLLLTLLSPLFRRNASGRVLETHLFFSPKVISRAPYLQRYANLKTFLTSHGIEAAQPITNERLY